MQEYFAVIWNFVRQSQYYVKPDYTTFSGMQSTDTYKCNDITAMFLGRDSIQQIYTNELDVTKDRYGNITFKKGNSILLKALADRCLDKRTIVI